MPGPSYRSGLVSLFTSCAVEASLIFLPLFAEEIGASKLEMGIMGSAGGVSYFVSSWLFGRQSDIRGRVLFIRLGLGLSLAAFAAQALVVNALTLIFIRALVGFCLGISSAALQAFNFETGGSTGKFASLGSLGWLMGDAFAFFVHSYYVLFLLSAASCSIAFVISMTLKEPAIRKSLRPDTFLVVRRNLKVYLPFFVRHLGANMVWVVFPLFLASLGASKPWIAVLSAVNTGGQFIAMMFVERLKESRVFLLGFLLSALVFLAYSQATSFIQLLPVEALLALAWSSLYVGALLLLLKNNEERATSTGILFSTISLAGAAGPFLGGMVAQFWGFRPLMYFAAGFCLAGFGIARNSSYPHPAHPKAILPPR